jgi:hypothetical protein
MPIYVGFDMGIRNLAYCVIEHGISGEWSIAAWDNVDLLEGGETAQTAKSCAGCGGGAKWICVADGMKWCKACATGVRVKKSATAKPSLPCLPCDMGAKELKALATGRGVDAKKMKKPDLVAWAQKMYLVPWKAVKTMSVGLGTIRKAMDTWLTSVLSSMARAELIRLENQPVMKNPTMKSVQIMLYTLLAHRLETEYFWTGNIDFVHAGVKSRAVDYTDISGASGEYKARKDTAEVDVAAILAKGGAKASVWAKFFAGRTKKSDLADAFLMAMRLGI